MSKVLKPEPFTGLKSDATYLFLISPDKIPHLVLVKDLLYYALTYKESVIGADFSAYFNALKRSRKRMIILELTDIERFPETVFSQYQEAGEKTCFVPVKESLLSSSESNFIYQLVPDLYKANKIVKAYQLNLEEELDDLGDFRMNEYSLQDIYSYIESLKNEHAERNKSISENP